MFRVLHPFLMISMVFLETVVQAPDLKWIRHDQPEDRSLIRISLSCTENEMETLTNSHDLKETGQLLSKKTSFCLQYQGRILATDSSKCARVIFSADDLRQTTDWSLSA